MQARQQRGTKASKEGPRGTRHQPPILTHLHTTSTIVAARPTHAVAHTLPFATTCLSTLVRDPRCAHRRHHSTQLATSSSSTLSCLRYCSHTHTPPPPPTTTTTTHASPCAVVGGVQVEAFKPGECGHTDIWPCPPRNSKQLHPTLDWKQLGTQIKRIPSL